MKKIVLGVLTAGILTTGAMADMTSAVDSATNDLSQLVSKGFEMGDGTITAGAGYANMSAESSASLSVNYNKQLPLATWNFDGEASKGYLSVTSKVAPQVISGFDNPFYVGFGYFDVKAQDKDINSTDIYSTDPVITKHNIKKAGAGLFGINKSIPVGTGALTADLGMRFGGVVGPVASVGYKAQFNKDLVLGLKVEAEKILSNVEDIDRVGLYTTITF